MNFPLNVFPLIFLLNLPSMLMIFKNGYVFRLSVVHYREMVLYKETVTTTTTLKREFELAGKHMDTFIVKKPLHTSLIHG